MALAVRNKIAEKVVGVVSRMGRELSLEEVLRSTRLQLPKDSGIPQLVVPMSALCTDGDQDSLAGCLRGVFEEEHASVSSSSICFNLDKKSLIKDALLHAVVQESGRRSHSSLFNNILRKRVVVDFSSPNIAKPFHVGHLRSTIIGNVVCNLNSLLGHQVTRINYLGDWGTQFGILTAGFEKFGKMAELGAKPLEYLLAVYVKSNEMAENDPSFRTEAMKKFLSLEAGSPDIVAQWKIFKDLSMREYAKLYERIGVSFDVISGESDYSKAVQQLLTSLAQNSTLSTREDGVQGLFVKTKDEPRFVPLAKSDGSSLYLARDVAAVLDRKKKYNFDTAYYVVDSSQSGHFEALKAVLETMGYEWHTSIKHVKFGRIQGMSTRKGEIVLLESLLAEAKDRAAQAMQATQTTRVFGEDAEAVADTLGIAGVFVAALRMRRARDTHFSWDQALHNRGDSGVSLQYAHARLCSLEEKAAVPVDLNCDTALLKEPEALEVAVQLARWDETVLEAYSEMEPCVLVQYLFSLSHAVSRANKALMVKGQDSDLASARLLLFHASRKVLSQGLQLLGISPLSRM
ncbi:probable arginine--tRNA ligase, mitochondrial [Ornithodoros turicata]|uniref:probable arginine--tRNA ligase, mitochondrial n=1 Tax=Ornithodoros turicata TaxID=34597 RepID=UPI0031390785